MYVCGFPRSEELFGSKRMREGRLSHVDAMRPGSCLRMV